MPSVQRKPPSQNTKKTDPFYLSSEWRGLRNLVLSGHPLCYYCKLKSRVTPATIGDHFRPRRLYPQLSLVHENIKPSCDECHNKKRQFESKIASQVQFEREIGNFIESLKTH